ncbi:MAG: M81 family metallopeptidase, partial [Lachnospiraceae bacterium]|nr:M81 family metallopeptidase [Lachnospiraceae bacterium]
KPLDAITLSLHGSMRVKGQGEAEGYLLEELRALFPDIPIFASLDMHTTMTDRMHENCDGFVGYKCAPHTDCTETGEHAARMTIEALDHGVQAKSAWVRVPIIIAGEQSSTTVEPMITLIKELRETEKKEGILAASYLMGFPWADNEDSSVAVYVVANDQELANKEAVRLAEFIWSKKDEFCFQTEAYHEAEALDQAFDSIAKGQYPVFLSDSGDNPTAGSSSDCTELLKMIMNDERTKDLKNPVLYGGFYDPEATKACEGKVGQEVTLTFGAKFDTKTTTPITATGVVMKYVKDWTGFGGNPSDVAVFRTHNVDVILAEKHIGYASPKVYLDMGLNPAEAPIVVCKLGYLGEEHEAFAKRAILVLTKGSTNEDLKTLHYEKVPRPLFPLDHDFDFDAKANLK